MVRDGSEQGLGHAGGTRLEALDGLRATSILLVLGCHMLPLGFSSWKLNSLAGVSGMAIFFTLSGFLITQALLKSPAVVPFLVRRFARIIPLAWLATAVYLAVQGKGPAYYFNTLFFTINYNHRYVTPLTSPFWSLCVEMHFYLGVAAIVLAFGRRGLLLLPALALAITALRIHDGVMVSIMTHYRVDEILAGATLALVWLGELGRFGRGVDRVLRAVPLVLLAAGFAAASYRPFGPLLYARPYLAAAFVGGCLHSTGRFRALLASRPLRYIAEVSYAVYVIHSFTRYGWLSSGSKLTVLLKRPLAFALIFGLAHLSTFYFEAHFIALGKRFTRRWQRPRAEVLPEAPPVAVAAGPHEEPAPSEPKPGDYVRY